jgi:drug/metabolite transporter (DMT)-like permease
MPIYELAALAAACTWAIGGIISPVPAAHLGAITFGRYRLWSMFVLMGIFIWLTGRWQSIPTDAFTPVLLSGLIGIFLGDTALFATMNRLGPRRTAMLFSLNAPISAVLGYAFLSQSLTPTEIIGILTVTTGVIIAIMFGKGRNQQHKWESIKGPLWIGIILGLLAATGQSVGSLIASPILSAGADPIAVSCIRIGIAAFCLQIVAALPFASVKTQNPINLRIATLTFFSGFLAMGVGMTLVLFALSGGPVGIISTLTSTVPALMLPILWITTRERPAAMAWLGALLVVIGSSLIFGA